MARTVAVTGGSGKLDCAVVAALIEDGWAVVNFDRVPSSDSRARLIRTHLTDYGQVVEAISGIDEVHRSVDAVVQLAADLRHVPPKFECDIAERRIDISPRSVTQATRRGRAWTDRTADVRIGYTSPVSRQAGRRR
jgi:NAD(P)-dependent dehydrogenase (short-subunit alcohol dehydrogenase family)